MWLVSRFRMHRRRRRPVRVRRSGCARWPVKRTSSTSSISSSRDARKKKSKRTSAVGSSASTGARQATCAMVPTFRSCRAERSCATSSFTRRRCRTGYRKPISTCTRASSSIPVSSVRCRDTATSIATGKIWPDSPTGRSRFRRCSSADRATARPSGADPSIERFPETLPKLYKSEIIDGAGHWIQQEAAPRTNELLIEFLRSIH